MRFIYSRFKGDATIYYGTEYVSIDTETADNHDEEKPITWINTIQVKFNGKEYLFRKPMELIGWLQWLINEYRLNRQYRILIIIHNLSFDISFLIPYFQLYLPAKDDINILNNRHKIKAYRQGGLDFRDTLALTNKSLDRWGKDLDVEHKKLVGIYDYDRIIYQDSILDKNDIDYDMFDVRCLHECFEKQMHLEKDTVATIPFTSTGYIRRTFRKGAINNKEYMTMFRASRPTEHQFELCLLSYAGGYTHNNRHMKNKVIKGLIGHMDFRSHYPSQMRIMPQPFGKPITVYDPINRISDRKEKWSIQRILDCYPEYSTITVLSIEKAVLKDDGITMPYMQVSKLNCMTKDSRYIADNGRILSFNGSAIMCLDNFTLKILFEQYNIKAKILEILAFKNYYMPKCLADTIDMYFKDKTDEKIKLKQIEKEYGEFSEQAILQNAVLMHKKAGLNGCYGMFAQNPIHDKYDIDFTKDLTPEQLKNIYNPVIDDTPIEEKIDMYYNNKNSFLPFVVGGFVCAQARHELYEYITCIGYDKVLYCDTDSIFYLKDAETEKRIEKLNKQKNKNAEKLKAYVKDSNGNKIYYDVFEKEEDGKAFKGLHSKCYAMIIEEKGVEKLKATIAGVPSRTLIHKEGEKLIYLTREEELCELTPEEKIAGNDKTIDPWKGIDNLRNDFTFKVNTGTTAKYIIEKPHTVNVNGHDIETAGGIIIRKLEEKKIKDLDTMVVDFETFVTEIE